MRVTMINTFGDFDFGCSKDFGQDALWEEQVVPLLEALRFQPTRWCNGAGVTIVARLATKYKSPFHPARRRDHDSQWRVTRRSSRND
jgi:hypothetical protein